MTSCNQILLGKTKINESHIGFGHSKNVHPSGELLKFSGEDHLITIAGTGCGKGVSSVIPNQLSYTGPIICVDPKGEQYAVTHRRRIEMGHKVVLLDPFGVTPYQSDTFNPLDIRLLSNFDVELDSFTIAHLLSGKGSLEDPFWDNWARSIVAAYTSYVIDFLPAKDKNLGHIRSFIAKDMAYEIACILDSHEKKLKPGVKDAFASYLNIPSDRTRPSVDSTAANFFTSLFSEKLDRFMSKSSFDLLDIVSGKPTDIYLVMPPDKLRSHDRLFKLIIATLFKAILSRKNIPQNRTLFMLDECAALGHFEMLENIVGLCRGYGMQLQMVFQDTGQLKSIYKEGAHTLLNNCGVWQIFGVKKFNIAKEIGELTGIDPYKILNMAKDEQLLLIDNEVHFPSKKLNYLYDEEFAGLFDPNPYHEKTI